MLRPPATDAAQRLRDFLTGTGFTAEGLLEAFGTLSPPSPQNRTEPRLLDLTREPSRFNTLVRWFFVGVPVVAEQARECLPEWFLSLCCDCGLLRTGGDGFEPASLVVPCGSMLIASDLNARGAQPDYVLRMSPSALYLLNFTVRHQVAATLDLCGGSGVQALAAASHSEQVVATDLNPRATAFAAFNARLNGLENVECLTGDLFEPVGDRSFDLILCNPPFVLSPVNEFLYRDNDLPLDQLCRRIVREAPCHLKEGGYFQMICEWVARKGQEWPVRLAEWFDGSGCDVWVFENVSEPPESYAETRMREMHQDEEAAAEGYSQWVSYYREHGVEAIYGGLIAMRRRDGANRLRFQDLPGDLEGPIGEAILRGFANQDFLEAHATEEQILAAKLRLAPDAVLEQQYRWHDGQWQTRGIQLRHTTGLPQGLALDGHVAEFLERCDGQRSLGEVIEQYAATIPADSSEVRRKCLPVIKRLIEKGFLLP